MARNVMQTLQLHCIQGRLTSLVIVAASNKVYAVHTQAGSNLGLDFTVPGL